MQRFQEAVIALIVGIQPVPFTVSMIGAVTARIRVEVKVKFNPVRAIFGNQLINNANCPIYHGRISHTDISQRLSIASCDKFRMLMVKLCIFSNCFNLTPNSELYAGFVDRFAQILKPMRKVLSGNGYPHNPGQTGK